MAMTLEELRRKAGTSEPGATVKPKAQTMTLDELRKKAGTTAPAQPARVQPQISQPEQTAGENSSAVSFEKPVAETVDVNKKYGLVDGKVVLPSHIENQGLYAAPGTEKSKVNYLMDSAAKGLAGGIVTAGETVMQNLMGEGGKASREFYDYAMESAYNPQVAGQMGEYLKAKQDAEKNEKLRTDTLGYKLLESSDADMAKAQEGMGAVGQFMTGVVGSALQNAYLAPLAVINPGIASAMMALSAAGRTAKEKSDEGNTLKQAMVRGAIDGTIEYFTEKLPMESLAKRLTGEGDDIVKFVLQQVASEAGEEGVSYAAGVMADILSKNPDAQFSVQDLALNMLAGGMAGGLLAGGGIAVGTTVNTLKTAQQPSVDTTQTEANPVPKQPVGVKEYVDTLKESAKGNAQNNLNGEYKKTGMTAAEYVEKNLDGNFYQEKNKLYFMEKDGTKVPVSKTVHDYAKYLQANRPQTATVNQTADAGNVAQITEPQNVQQTTPVQQASQTVEQQTVKDINVPSTNVGNTIKAPTEEMKQLVRDMGEDESKQAEIKEYARANGLGDTVDMVDAFAKKTGVTVRYYNGQLGQKVKGMREGNTIYVDIANKKHVILYTAIHEHIHALKTNNKAAYDKLAKRINTLQKNSDKYNVLAEMAAETYAEMGETNIDRVTEEIVAKLCESAVENPEAFLAKFGKERTIVDMVYDFLRELKNTITAYFGGSKAERARVDNALLALEQYLRNEVGGAKSEAKETQLATSAFNKNSDENTKEFTPDYLEKYGGIAYEVKWIDLTKALKSLYNAGKNGDEISAVQFAKDIVRIKTVERFKSYGENVYILPVSKLKGKNRNSNALAEYISSFANQKIFNGIYQNNAESTKAKSVWERMKIKHPDFYALSEDIKADIAGKRFILIDDNSTSGRTFAGLRSFIEDNGGEVVDYYAPTIGQDNSEVNRVTKEYWEENFANDLEAITSFAKKEGIQREISPKGLTQNEAETLIKRFKPEHSNSRNTSTDGRKTQGVYGSESQNETVYGRTEGKRGIETERLKDTPKGVSSSFAENVDGTVTNSSGAVVATNTDSNEPQFNIQTFEDGGREFLERYLNKKDMDAKAKQDILDSMDAIYNMVKEYNTTMSSEYPAFTQWCEAKPIVDDDGNIIMSVIVPNGDYKMNIDVSTVCKKRKTLDAVLNKMAESGDLSVYSMSQPDIVKMNKIIKKHGFEVACSMCFVDAKRYRIGNWANSFADMYNSIVETIIPEGSGIVLDQFNYSEAKVKTPKGRKADKVKTTELRWDEVNRMINDKNVKPIMREMAKAIKINPSMRKLLSSGDLISSKGMDNMKAQNAELYKLTNRHMGTAKPKTSHSETPYTNEVLKADGWTAEKAYAVGGVRIQSFSDYMANMFFDYAQIIADLSAKELPGHAYTKELDFAKIFGLTGLKINLSAMPRSMSIPAEVRAEWEKLSDTKRKEHPLFIYYQQNAGLDGRGNYLWADESIDVDEAIKLQNTDGYGENVGIICVGISDKHIRKLMADDNMKMVIPYHKSGINPVVAKMQDIDIYTDYTNEQNTRYAKSGKKIRKNSYHFDFYADLAKTKNPRETAENYVRDCESRNFLPKFDRFAYKLDSEGNRIKGTDGKYVVDENYYKLLIDFRVYNGNGKYAPQGAIKMNYPEPDVLNKLVKDSLKLNEKTAAKLDNEMEELLADIKKELSIKDSQRINTKPIYSGNYEVKFDTQNSVDISDAEGTGKYKGKDIQEIAEAAISESQQKRAKAQALLDERKQKNAKLVPEKWAKAQAEKANKDGLPESVGAAKANPKNITHMVNEYGEMKPGENPSRFVSMPVSTDGDDRVGKFARTAAEAEVTSDKMVEAIEKAVAKGQFSHEIYRDKTAISEATSYIEKYGYKKTLDEFYKRVDNNSGITKQDMVKAMTMYAVAVENDDIDTALKLAVKINKAAVTAGQVIQSVRILKKASPEGRMYYAQKSLEAYQDEVDAKYGQGKVKLKVDDAVMQKLKDARTEAEIEEATAELHQVIADQLPFSWSNFINSWRYLAMLGNPRTQVRNVLSNAINTVASEYTNWIQSGLEKVVKGEKSTTAQKPTKEQIDFAERDYEKVKAQLSGEGKYKNDSLTYIETLKNPFSFPTFWGKQGDEFIGWKGSVRKAGEPIMKGLTKWNEATNKAMEGGDLFFSSKAYKKAMSRYLKVNDINPANITIKQLSDARAWATRQALESVFRESNIVANAISRTERNLLKSSNKAEKAMGIIVGGIMPFRGTPLNITKRAFEYTPLGVVKGVADIKLKDDVYMPEAINSIAKGLSGTSLIILGMFLAKAGILKGGLGTDKEDKMKDQMGEQSYSISTPNYTYTLDWGGAAVMPLFVGADIYESNSEDESWLANAVNALANAGSPIVETSMMTGLMDAIKSASYEDKDTEKIMTFLSSGIASYLGQFVPTILGQVARAVDDTSRSSYTDVKGVMKPLAKTAEKAQNKIPFASMKNIPYMDVWGNDVKNVGGNVLGRMAYNMLSPGYLEKKSTDKVEKMLADLYDKTGDTSVLPSNYTTHKKIDGENIRFTDKQFEAYTKAYGQTAYNLIAELSEDNLYKSRSDAEKVDAIKKVYEMALNTAGTKVLGISHDNATTRRMQAVDEGIPISLIYASLVFKSDIDTNESNEIDQAEAKAYIDKYGKDLSDAEKAALFKIYSPTTKNNPYD